MEIEKESSMCTHYWKFDEARAPTSRGVCKMCGAECELSNGKGVQRESRTSIDRIKKRVPKIALA